ncbi:MAG: homoserine kinase [Lachnospiraceae bacterium]
MYKISVPASTANLGPGFDCLGLALSLYNDFYVEESDAITSNLVYNAYIRVLSLRERLSGQKASSHGLSLKIDTGVPVSRGLGSSATCIIAGAIAGNLLHPELSVKLTPEELFKECSDMEGHPDNVAPALFGGLRASMMTEQGPVSVELKLHKNFHFTVLIPDYEVSTQEARSILPEKYSRKDTVSALSHAVLLSSAFGCGNPELLSLSAQDCIHEPYRKQLIPGFDEMKAACEKAGGCSFLISGSGSTCLAIWTNEDFMENLKLQLKEMKRSVIWTVKEVQPVFASCLDLVEEV